MGGKPRDGQANAIAIGPPIVLRSYESTRKGPKRMQPTAKPAPICGWIWLLVAFLIAFDMWPRGCCRTRRASCRSRPADCLPRAYCAFRRWRSLVPVAWHGAERHGAAGRGLAHSAVVYAAIALPASPALLTRRWRGSLPVVATMVPCSLALLPARRMSRSGPSAACTARPGGSDAMLRRGAAVPRKDRAGRPVLDRACCSAAPGWCSTCRRCRGARSNRDSFGSSCHSVFDAADQVAP